MKIVEEKISVTELKQIAESGFGDFVKGVVDIEKEIIVIDAELHSDEEGLLLQNGSQQRDLWGINIYPFNDIDKMIEFDSMINIRPRQGNRSRDVEDIEVRNKIMLIFKKLLKYE